MHALNFLRTNISHISKRITTKRLKILRCSCKFYNHVSTEDFTDISLSVMKNTLKSRHVKFEEGHACLLTDCPMCAAQSTKDKGPKIYINKTTGFFSCQCCKHGGPWKILQTFYNLINGEKAVDELSKKSQLEVESYRQLIVNTKPLAKYSEEARSSIRDSFKFSVADISSLILLNARIDPSLENMYIPLLDTDNKTAGYKVLTSSGTEKTIPSTNGYGLLSAKPTRLGGNSAVVVPTLKDALALLNAKVPGHVICLPYGLVNLPQTLLPNFEKYTKLVLWFGNEASSWDTARTFAKKLGEKRCYFVRPTDETPPPAEAFLTGQDIKVILSTAQPIWHKAITTFASLRQDVLSDLQNIDKVQGVKWKRFPSLSKILKGHRRGELTVITGPTGCGKTTFVSEYSLDLAMQNVNTLWGSFEIRNARLARTMLQQMAECELDEHLDKFDEWADRFEQLPVYFMTFHGQQQIKVVMEAVEHATYVHDIAHVIIDNVQFMMGISEEPRHVDRFWKQDAIVASFRTFATRKNCHVTLVMHPRKERDTDELTTSSIFGGAKASQEADNVLIIQDKRLVSVRGKKYLQVVKNRYSGDLGIVPLDFDKAALSYAQKKKKVEEKVKAETA